MKLFIIYLSTDCRDTWSYKDALFQKLACVLRKQFSAVLLRFFGSRWTGKRLILGFWLRGVAFPLSQALAGNQGLHAPGWLPKEARQGRVHQGGSSQGPSSTSLKSFSTSASRRWLAVPLKGFCPSCKSFLMEK